MKPAPCIPVLAAPTASGKSAVALQLADRLPSPGLEIVTADAMQVYRGMDIGTAKPDALDRSRHPHHLIDLVSPAEPFSVALWVHAAERVIAEILERGRLPFVVGGTGFYIRALTQGLPTVPPADREVQEVLYARLESEGLAALVGELEAAAPEDARRAQNNPRRVVRSLEVLERTGRPPSAFAKRPPLFTFSKVVLLPPATELRERIGLRTGQMFAAGLVSEVAQLLAAYPEQLTATQAIGYKEVVAHLQGGATLDETVEAIELATVRYARRQRTWFRREPEAERIDQLAEAALPELLAWLQAL